MQAPLGFAPSFVALQRLLPQNFDSPFGLPQGDQVGVLSLKYPWCRFADIKNDYDRFWNLKQIYAVTLSERGQRRNGYAQKHFSARVEPTIGALAQLSGKKMPAFFEGIAVLCTTVLSIPSVTLKTVLYLWKGTSDSS